MSRAHIPRASTRIIARLQQQERKAVGYREQSLARLAFLIATLAQDGKPDPVGRAVAQLRRAWGFKFECEVERFATEPELPVPIVREVDERTGEQWARSAMDYLAWRSGQNWRTGLQRKVVPHSLSELEIYSDAIREVNLALHRKHDPAKLIALSRAVLLSSQKVFEWSAAQHSALGTRAIDDSPPKKKPARQMVAGPQRMTA